MSADDCVGCRHINNCLGDCVGFAKPKPQTNEEWLRTAPREELAEFLSRFVGICAVCENNDKFDDDACCENGICPYGEDNRKALGMWLQEKHT